MSEEEVRLIISGAAAAGTLNALETISVYLKSIIDLEMGSKEKHSTLDLLVLLQHALERHIEGLKKSDIK